MNHLQAAFATSIAAQWPTRQIPLALATMLAAATLTIEWTAHTDWRHMCLLACVILLCAGGAVVVSVAGRFRVHGTPPARFQQQHR
jgi:ABC-type transport system involved in cytochrome c biogenesis permease component